jgi:hypothetical protein
MQNGFRKQPLQLFHHWRPLREETAAVDDLLDTEDALRFVNQYRDTSHDGELAIAHHVRASQRIRLAF